MDEEEEDVPRTKVRVRALEIYQKQELLHHANARPRLEELEKKNDLLPIVTNLVHRMDTLQSDLRRCLIAVGFNTFYWVFLVGFHQDSMVFSLYLTLILR